MVGPWSTHPGPRALRLFLKRMSAMPSTTLMATGIPSSVPRHSPLFANTLKVCFHKCVIFFSTRILNKTRISLTLIGNQVAGLKKFLTFNTIFGAYQHKIKLAEAFVSLGFAGRSDISPLSVIGYFSIGNWRTVMQSLATGTRGSKSVTQQDLTCFV